MRLNVLAVILSTAAVPALAHGDHDHGATETRQMDAHVHGVSELSIAVEGTTVAMELWAPGADIVGFEYAAETDADKAAVAAAITTLRDPLSLFTVPAAAGCLAVEVEAHLHGAGAGDHDHDHDHGATEAAADTHDHDHDHDHADADGHSAFHAVYGLTCADPAALTTIGFAYFDAFPGAEEVEVQVVGPNGAQAFEVKRAAPVLALDGLM